MKRCAGIYKVWGALVVFGFSLAIAGLVLAACQPAETQTDNASNATDTEAPTPLLTGAADQEMITAVDEAAQADEVYMATIDVKDYGTIVVELQPKTAPTTVANFITLAEDGFYDGLTFHRIIDGFMIQGGDPNGNGTGGSGDPVVGEFAANGHPNDLSHVRGVISMARSQAYDSASSQFFIVQSDSTNLDGQYAAFGEVVSGMDVVDAISKAAEPTDSNGTIAKEVQPVITSITISGPEKP